MFPFCHFGGSWGMGSWGAWGWVGMGLQMLLWIGLIVAAIVLIVWLIRRSGSSYAVQTSSSSREILQSRYARGEISRDEYLRMLDDLK